MFKPSKPVAGTDVKYGLIDNSQTLAKGQVIIPGVQGDTPVVKTGGSTTAGLLGVVLSIVGQGGKVLELDSKAVASDNVTVGLIKVCYLPLYIPMEFEVDLDAASETTDDSSAYGNFAVDSTGLLLSESSYVAFGTVAAKQFFSFGVQAGSTTKCDVRYMRSTII